MSTSAPNLNSVTLVGQLTGDPELRSLPDGRSVCNLRLAVNDQRDQPPMFIDVATFGPGVEACAEYLSKGRSVGVTGRLVLREWQGKDGSKRSKHSIVGRVSFGGKSEETASNQVLTGRSVAMTSSRTTESQPPGAYAPGASRRLDGPLLGPDEAAALLAVKTSWVYDAVRTGTLPAFGLGGTSASRGRCLRRGSLQGRRRR